MMLGACSFLFPSFLPPPWAFNDIFSFHLDKHFRSCQDQGLCATKYSCKLSLVHLGLMQALIVGSCSNFFLSDLVSQVMLLPESISLTLPHLGYREFICSWLLSLWSDCACCKLKHCISRVYQELHACAWTRCDASLLFPFLFLPYITGLCAYCSTREVLTIAEKMQD